MKLEWPTHRIVFSLVLLVIIALVPTFSMPTTGYGEVSMAYLNTTNCSTIEDDVSNTNMELAHGSRPIETCIYFSNENDFDWGVWMWFNCSDTTGDWMLYEYDTKSNCIADLNRTSPDYGPSNSSYNQCTSDGDEYPYYFRVVCPLPVLSLTYANGTNCSTIDDVSNTNVHAAIGYETCMFFGNDPIYGVWVWFNCSDITGDWKLYEYGSEMNCIADSNRTAPDWGPANSTYNECAWDNDSVNPYYFRVVCPLPIAVVHANVKLSYDNCSSANTLPLGNYEIPVETCSFFDETDPFGGTWMWLHCDENCGGWTLWEYDNKTNCKADWERIAPDYGPAHSSYGSCASDNYTAFPYYFKVTCPKPAEYAEVSLSYLNGTDCATIEDASNTDVLRGSIGVETCIFFGVDPVYGVWVWFNCSATGDWILFEYDTKWNCIADSDRTSPDWGSAYSKSNQCASDKRPIDGYDAINPYYFKVVCPLTNGGSTGTIIGGSTGIVGST